MLHGAPLLILGFDRSGRRQQGFAREESKERVMLKRLLIIVTLMSAAACAPMTADRPLFSVTDQAGPAPLREGLWIGVGEECHERLRTRRNPPLKCIPSTLSRAADGSWLFHMRGPPDEGRRGPQERDVRLLIAPGVERALDDAYAPLYVAEYRDPDAQEGPAPLRYAALIPAGPMPAEDLTLFQIDCADALRDGPIRGLTPVYTRERGEERMTGCIAHSKTAVREAARRAVIENENEAGMRFVLVRPERQNPAPHAR
jgi:hypothetical protein